MADRIRILCILHGAQIWTFEFGDEDARQRRMFWRLRFDSHHKLNEGQNGQSKATKSHRMRNMPHSAEALATVIW
ncbi:hypothetical protein ATY81_02680 [Rhizobium sp. R72]|nr:hypothetical protein ATY81_02680 [Rhizobium sp. R72]OWW05948.1 hypothetical protein ATY80_02680 [Rhizobium sp. R711]